MKLTRRSPVESRRIVMAALAFGLVTGLLEGTAFVVLQKLNWLTAKVGLIDVSVDIIWIAVVFDVLLFLCIGVVFLLASLILNRLPVLKVAIFAFSFLALFDWLTLLLFGRVRVYTIGIIAFGLSVQATRLIAKHEIRLFKIYRPLVLSLLVVAVLMGITVRLYQSVEEKRAIANLPSPKSGSPNIVLIVIDALRADHLSSYGYSRPTSRNIDQLASGGVLFENAFSASSWTLPSHASLLTGRYAIEHNADWSNPTALVEASYSTLAEALAARGYRTAGFSGNLFWVTQQFGIDRGFIHFEDYFHSMGDMLLRTVYGRAIEAIVMRRVGFQDIPARRRASDINDSVWKWVSQSKEKPFFVFINYMDVHDPYLPPAPYRQRYSNHDKPGGILNWRVGRSDPAMSPQQLEDEISAYDGAIAYVDDQIGMLVANLKSAGMTNTLFIITSDHGEMFGEHNLYLHGHSLYRKEIHVPLILNYQGSVPTNTRIAQPVSNSSVPATVMALITAEDQSVFPGTSLAHLWNSGKQKNDWPPVASYVARQSWVSPKLPIQHGSIHSLINNEWHYIQNENLGAELYRWRDDPGELNNLSQQPETQDLIRAFRAELQNMNATTAARKVVVTNSSQQ